MATSAGITNVRATRLEGHRILFSADYAHTLGAAPETLDVPAGRLNSVTLIPLGTANSQKVDLSGAGVTTSVSGSVQTLTFNGAAEISAGVVSVEVQVG